MPDVTGDDTFIFPLNTVLFPGGLLPLKIFEQRYNQPACSNAKRSVAVPKYHPTSLLVKHAG